MNTSPVTPAEPGTSSGEAGSPRYDPSQRLTAARIQQANPGWLLIWGTHSRRYFAFPLFGAARGTILTASDPDRLLTGMRRAEAAAVHPDLPPAHPIQS